ncbi:hypothetical protein ACHAWF_001058 [Thalassiosira exigua]
MNNSLAFLFCLAVLPSLALAFSPAPRLRSGRRKGTTLDSIVFEPPVEENCELDGSNCEESVFDRKRRERSEADDLIKSRYHMRGIELSDADLYETVDQHQNAPTGGNLIAGIHLTALCEDD